jgi:hypothetical protein
MIAFHLEIVARLQIEPEAVTGSKISSEAKRGIRRYGASAMNNLIDTPSGHTDVLGKTVLRNPEWLQEVEGEDFAGMNWGDLTMGHKRISSVVIDERDVKRVTILPTKADPPLIVNANAMLAGAITFELLQSITGRNAKVFELLGGVDQCELAKHHTLEIARKATHKFAAE